MKFIAAYCCYCVDLLSGVSISLIRTPVLISWMILFIIKYDIKIFRAVDLINLFIRDEASQNLTNLQYKLYYLLTLLKSN